MIIAVAKETFPGERRVALVPALVATLKKYGGEVRVETGAGAAAGFTDDAYRAAGAEVYNDRRALFESADVVLQVRTLGANHDQPIVEEVEVGASARSVRIQTKDAPTSTSSTMGWS
jgi:NAD(P) transhydrogenase subunit alpha